MTARENATSHSDIAAIITALPLLLRETRRSRRLSARAMAYQLGVSASTVARIDGLDDNEEQV